MTETTRYPLEKFEANSVRLDHEGKLIGGVELVFATRFSNGKSSEVRFLVTADLAQNLAAQIAQAAQNSTAPAAPASPQVH